MHVCTTLIMQCINTIVLFSNLQKCFQSIFRLLNISIMFTDWLWQYFNTGAGIGSRLNRINVWMDDGWIDGINMFSESAKKKKLNVLFRLSRLQPMAKTGLLCFSFSPRVGGLYPPRRCFIFSLGEKTECRVKIWIECWSLNVAQDNQRTFTNTSTILWCNL